MISRYEVELNNVSLESLSPAILILDVNYTSVSPRDETVAIAKRQGARVYRRYVDRAEVSISFEIHEYDTRKRQAVRDAVCRWAKDGGKLETNDRSGQYLQCICTEFPAIESVRNWTDPIQIRFTAYEVPFWQEKNPILATLSGSSDSSSVYVPGSANGAFVEATAHTNASLSSISFGVNGRILTLSGLSVAANSDIVISYDTQGIQSIKVGNTSLLNKRTGVDDLLANCGEFNTFSVSASASVDVTFSVRGLWI